MGRILLLVAVFLTSVYFLVPPSERMIEAALARDVSSDPPKFFPVLVRAADAEGRFVIGQFGDLRPESKLVTEISDQDVARVNRDLGLRIGQENSTYPYFKIIRRTPQYADVSLEVPTTRDFYRKSWYRLQNKSIYPQRFMWHGPSTATFTMFLPCLIGAIAVWCCNKLLRRRAGARSRDQRVPTSTQASS